MNVARRGTMFVEACVAIAIVAVTFVVIAQLLALVAQQRRAEELRHVATREAANLMERVMATPWGALTDERLAEWELSPIAASRLRNGRVNIELIAHDQQFDAKVIRVRVDWLDAGGQRGRGVQLVSWKHRVETEASP